MKNGKKPRTDIIIDEALSAAINAAVPPPMSSKVDEKRAPSGERELDILFYGLMCFDPLPRGSGYRVLFPNGLDLTELTDIPVHSAGLWIRGRDARVTSRWSGFALRNDFFVSGKQQLTISGLAKTPLDTTEFEGRVTNLQDCDPAFEVSDEPDAVIDMIVDRGTLSAHVGNDQGMIVVKWTVQVERGAPVRFAFGSDFVELPESVTQVVLANVSPKPVLESVRDFQLFRKLATAPDRPLKYKLPNNPPTNRLEVKEPTFGLLHAAAAPEPATEPGSERTPGNRLRDIVGVVPQAAQDAVALTPDVVCSAVVSRSRDAA